MKSQYEVIVMGSGPAGFSSAYYAAMNGADVLLVERNGTLGGMLTTGHMGVFCGYASSGLYSEICSTIGKRLGEGRFAHFAYDVETMRQFLYEKAEESGLSLLLYAGASAVRKKGPSLERLVIQAKEGPHELEAEIYIDATGDGDVAALAGEDFDLGRASDGRFQPMTLIFTIEGADPHRAPNVRDAGVRAALREKMAEYVKRGDVSELVGHVIIIDGCRKGSYKVNMTNVIGLDGTKSADLTKAEVECRRQQRQILRFIRKAVPGFEDCYMASSADAVGVRSTRHIHGKHVLNEKEISDGTIFDDWVVSTARYVWGTHNLHGPIHGKGQEDSVKSPYGALPHDKPYTIPFRSLRPRKTDNLLLAGRCISGTFLAHSNYRVMPICMAMGQGAGTAAALAVRNTCSLDDLDVRRVQEVLLNNGVAPPQEEPKNQSASVMS